jgi:hypothetical protein
LTGISPIPPIGWTYETSPSLHPPALGGPHEAPEVAHQHMYESHPGPPLSPSSQGGSAFYASGVPPQYNYNDKTEPGLIPVPQPKESKRCGIPGRWFEILLIVILIWVVVLALSPGIGLGLGLKGQSVSPQLAQTTARSLGKAAESPTTASILSASAIRIFVLAAHMARSITPRRGRSTDPE